MGGVGFLLQLVEDYLVFQVLEEVGGEIVPVVGGKVAGGEDKGVQAQPQGVFYHGWDYSGHEWTVDLEAGVGVDLNEPYVVLLIDHKI